MRKAIAILAFVATIIGFAPASAQSTETLSQNMHVTIVRCIETEQSSYITSDKAKTNECITMAFRALQAYIDAASACVKGLTNPEGCKEAGVIERNLIRTFRQPPATARR